MSGRPARRVRATTVTLVLTAALAVTLLPFAWMTFASFKTPAELSIRPPTWWPLQPTLANYTEWLTRLEFPVHFANSLVVAVFVVLGNLVFCSMFGYALAKLEFRGKRVLFVLVMTTLMVPGIVTMVPLFVLVANLGLVNTYPALILPFVATPLGVFLMRQYMHAVPSSLLDAARIDGAGEFRILFRIVLPLMGAPLATLGVLTFLTSWNNFLWPLVVAQTQDMYTVPVALSLYAIGAGGIQYGLLMAGSMLALLPILLLYLALHRLVIRAMTATGTPGAPAKLSDATDR